MGSLNSSHLLCVGVGILIGYLVLPMVLGMFAAKKG